MVFIRREEEKTRQKFQGGREKVFWRGRGDLDTLLALGERVWGIHFLHGKAVRKRV